MTNTFTIISNSFKEGEVIKNIYACPENRQPYFSWKGHPESTMCFVIIMDDVDAIPVVGHIFVHWNLFTPQLPFQLKKDNCLGEVAV